MPLLINVELDKNACQLEGANSALKVEKCAGCTGGCPGCVIARLAEKAANDPELAAKVFGKKDLKFGADLAIDSTMQKFYQDNGGDKFKPHNEKINEAAGKPGKISESKEKTDGKEKKMSFAERLRANKEIKSQGRSSSTLTNAAIQGILEAAKGVHKQREPNADVFMNDRRVTLTNEIKPCVPVTSPLKKDKLSKPGNITPDNSVRLNSLINKAIEQADYVSKVINSGLEVRQYQQMNRTQANSSIIIPERLKQLDRALDTIVKHLWQKLNNETKADIIQARKSLKLASTISTKNQKSVLYKEIAVQTLFQVSKVLKFIKNHNLRSKVKTSLRVKQKFNIKSSEIALSPVRRQQNKQAHIQYPLAAQSKQEKSVRFEIKKAISTGTAKPVISHLESRSSESKVKNPALFKAKDRFKRSPVQELANRQNTEVQTKKMNAVTKAGKNQLRNLSKDATQIKKTVFKRGEEVKLPQGNAAEGIVRKIQAKFTQAKLLLKSAFASFRQQVMKKIMKIIPLQIALKVKLVSVNILKKYFFSKKVIKVQNIREIKLRPKPALKSKRKFAKKIKAKKRLEAADEIKRLFDIEFLLQLKKKKKLHLKELQEIMNLFLFSRKRAEEAFQIALSKLNGGEAVFIDQGVNDL